MAGCNLGGAYDNEARAANFAGAQWGTRTGTTAVWVQALRRIDGYVVPKNSRSFGGIPCRCTLIPPQGGVS